uniref:RING-type E3 ubiquitin transferase n=1 Tax=Rhizophora mucronata TaxID=61149 RepID=A0A2P2LNX2_RHIMU
MLLCFVECAEFFSVPSSSHLQSAPLPVQQFQALSAINKGLVPARTSSMEIHLSKCQSLDIDEKPDTVSSCSGHSEVGHPISRSSSCKSLLADNQSWISDQASTSDVTDYSSFGNQVHINFELEKLKIELRHFRGMYAVAQTEAIDASRKWNNLNKRRLEEATKLKEISYREELAREVASQEKERCEAVVREADYIKKCTEREASQRLGAEIKAMRDAKEKEKLENALAGPVHWYQKFTWEEIVSATSSFSENLKIGMGAHGTVYKCSLHHTTGAVKVLHSKENQNTKQFLQELEILSKVHHPHLLILLGACPDHGCLVYEYMENGSLEERLLRPNKTPPIPWFDRFRIAWEVASALVFLHNFKPKPVIHRDLKPANILLDGNLVSKIGDVGLSTILQSDASSVSTMYKDTGPVGTLSYIDPEYQRTGLISAKSDVYAFGIVVLQLLTAKPALALAHTVETAINKGCWLEILDPAAGSWPLEETEELAKLGLSCAEMRRKDRPDLKDQVLPALERLKGVADRARNNTISNIWSSPPNHFICPIMKDVMNDPCVAADGYTYDRKAIQKWLDENDKSPMTNLPLPHRKLLPNFALMCAIMEWRSKNQ